MTPTLSYRGTIAVLELGGDEKALTAMTTGHRYGGPEAQAVALVDGTASQDEVLDAAVNRLTHLAGKDPGTLGAIKSEICGTVAALLSGD